jgi:small subunit ribosomal protein S16
MSARIRLKRFGTKKRPYYRIVVMDSRQSRVAATIEEVGIYHPIEVPEKQIALDEEKIRSWLGKGATATDTVRGLLNKKGITV